MPLCVCEKIAFYAKAFFYLDFRTGNNFLYCLSVIHIFTYSAY